MVSSNLRRYSIYSSSALISLMVFIISACAGQRYLTQLPRFEIRNGGDAGAEAVRVSSDQILGLDPSDAVAFYSAEHTHHYWKATTAPVVLTSEFNLQEVHQILRLKTEETTERLSAAPHSSALRTLTDTKGLIPIQDTATIRAYDAGGSLKVGTDTARLSTSPDSSTLRTVPITRNLTQTLDTGQLVSINKAEQILTDSLKSRLDLTEGRAFLDADGAGQSQKVIDSSARLADTATQSGFGIDETSGRPVLTLDKQGFCPLVAPGMTCEFRIMVNNIGAVSASDVWVYDFLPSNLKVISAPGARVKRISGKGSLLTWRVKDPILLGVPHMISFKAVVVAPISSH